MGDHAESIQVDFDPARIGYDELLEIFWTTHNPCRSPWSRQYMSAVFYENDEQLAAIERTRQKYVATPNEIKTEIAPLRTFYLAEDYHQKYRLRHDRALADELHAIYPDERDFVASTAAARLNAYLDGEGTRRQLEREIDQLGLSPRGRERLLQFAR